MKVSITRIGNSKGIRIPKTLLKQLKVEDTVELEAEKDRLIIRPVRESRKGWGKAFQKMRERGDDAILDGEIQSTEWDKREWQW
jgi:antitoxin MazE